MVEQCLQGRVDSEIRKSNGELVPVGHAHIAASEGFARVSSQMDAVAGEYPAETTDAQGRRPRILSKFVMRDSEGNVFHVLQQATRISVGNARAYCMWHQYAICGDSIRDFLQFPTKWVTLRFQDQERDWRDFYLGALKELEAQITFNLPQLSRVLRRFGMSPKAFEVLLCSLYITLPDPTTYVVVLFDDRAMPDHEELIRQLLVYIYMMLPMAMRRAVGFETWLSGRMSAEQCELFFASSRFVTVLDGYSGIRMGNGADALTLNTSGSYLFFGNRLFHFPEEGLPGEKGSFAPFIHPWVERICDDNRCFQDLQSLNQLYAQVYDQTPLGRKASEFVEQLQRSTLDLKSQEKREAVDEGFRVLSDYRSLMDYQQILEGTKQISFEELVAFTERFLGDMGAEGNRALAKLFGSGLDVAQISASREKAKIMVEVLKRLEKDSPAHRTVMQLMSECYQMKPLSLEDVDDFLLMAEGGMLPLRDDAWRLALDSYVRSTKAEAPGRDAAFAWDAVRHCLRLAIGRTDQAEAEVVSQPVRELAKRAALELMPRGFEWNADAEAARAMIEGVQGGDALLGAFVDRANLDADQTCDRLIADAGPAREFLWNKLDARLPRENLPMPLMHRLMEELPAGERKLETVERALGALRRPLNLAEMRQLLLDGRAQGGEMHRRAAAHALACGAASLAETLAAVEPEIEDARNHRAALLAYLDRQGAISDARDFDALIRAAGKCADPELTARLARLMDAHLADAAPDCDGLRAQAKKLARLPVELRAGRLEILLDRFGASAEPLDDCAGALLEALGNFPPDVVPRRKLAAMLERRLRDGARVRLATLERFGALSQRLKGEEMRGAMAMAIDRCELAQTADLRRLLSIGDSCDMRDCARERVLNCMQARPWGAEAAFDAVQMFLNRGDADAAAELLRRAALDSEDAPKLLAKLRCEGERRDGWPAGCLEALAERLGERCDDLQPTIAELRKLVERTREGKLPLSRALLASLVRRMVPGSGEDWRKCLDLLWLMQAEEREIAVAAREQAKRIASALEMDVTEIHRWLADAPAKNGQQVQYLLRLLLAQLNPEEASARQDVVLQILGMGQPDACDPEIVRLLNAGDCVTALKRFSPYLDKRSEMVQRAVIGALDEEYLAGSIGTLAFLDDFCVRHPEVTGAAEAKAEALFEGMRLDDALHAGRSFKIAQLRSLARERAARLLESGEGESAHSDDARFNDFLNAASWYADRPALQQRCCTRLLQGISGEDLRDGAHLIARMRAELPLWEGGVRDALRDAMLRCLESERTLLSPPENPMEEWEWHRKQSEAERDLFGAWLRACVRGGCFADAAFYEAVADALTALLADAQYTSLAQDCFAANIVPSVEKAIQRLGFNVDYGIEFLEQFGGQIRDEDWRRLILARSVARMKDSQTVLYKLLRNLINDIGRKATEEEKWRYQLEVFLWHLAFYTAFDAPDQAKHRKKIMADCAYAPKKANPGNATAEMQRLLTELGNMPFWRTEATKEFVECALRTMAEKQEEEDAQYNTVKMTDSELSLLNRNLGAMGAYRDAFCAYLDRRIKKLTARCVQEVFREKNPPILREDRKRKFGITSPKSVVEDCLHFRPWDARIADSLFRGICEGYAQILESDRTMGHLPYGEKWDGMWPSVDAKSPAFDGARDAECLLSFVLLQLLDAIDRDRAAQLAALNRPAAGRAGVADLSSVYDAMCRRYGADGADEVWYEALRRASLLGMRWMNVWSRQMEGGAAPRAEVIALYRSFANAFVYAHNLGGVEVAIDFMALSGDPGLVNALDCYGAQSIHAEFVCSAQDKFVDKMGLDPRKCGKLTPELREYLDCLRKRGSMKDLS